MGTFRKKGPMCGTLVIEVSIKIKKKLHKRNLKYVKDRSIVQEK